MEKEREGGLKKGGKKEEMASICKVFYREEGCHHWARIHQWASMAPGFQ